MKPNNPVFVYLKRNGMIDELLDYSIYMFRTSHLSLFNSATLLVQRRGIGFAASESTWLKKYNRLIRPEAKPLIIMKPFAPLDVFYEAKDTYSSINKDLPEWMKEKSIVMSAKTAFGINYLDIIPVLNSHGIYYGEKEFGSRLGGQMQYLTNAVGVEIKKKEKIFTIKHITQ